MRFLVLFLFVALVRAQSATQLYCECEVLTTVALDRAIIIVDCNVGADFEVPAQLSTCECAGVTATCTQGVNTRQTVNTPGTGFQPELCDDERFVAGNTFDSNTNCNGTCDGGAGYITDDRSDKTVDASSASCDFDYRYTECVNDIPCNRTDCVLSEIEYSACSKSCGGGQRTFNQTILAQPVNGGEECPDNETLSGFESCNTDPCPIDCEVSNWGAWSTCSESCNGTQSRVRTVTQNPQFGGEACPDLIETRDCNTGCSLPATDQPVNPGNLVCTCDIAAGNIPTPYLNVTVTCTTSVNFAMPDPPITCSCAGTSTPCTIGQTVSVTSATDDPYDGNVCSNNGATTSGTVNYDGNTDCPSNDGGCEGLITEYAWTRNIDPGRQTCVINTRYTNCNNLTNCTSTDCILGEVLVGNCSAECNGELNLTQTIAQHDASGVACPTPDLLITQEDCNPCSNSTTATSDSGFKNAGNTVMYSIAVLASVWRVSLDIKSATTIPVQFVGAAAGKVKKSLKPKLNQDTVYAGLLVLLTTVLVSIVNADTLDFVYTVSETDRILIVVGGALAHGVWAGAVVLLQSGLYKINKQLLKWVLLFYFFANLGLWSPVLIERSDADEGMAWVGVWILSLSLTALATVDLVGSKGKFALHGLGSLILIGVGLGAGLLLVFLVQIHLNHTDW